jgi:hypothetical protein
MSFKADMDAFVAKVRKREQNLYNACVRHVKRSIVYGSPVTGAPGQPVDSGDLRRSFRTKRIGRRERTVSSPLIYGPIIEDNKRGATLRSKVGGFHSIRLTRLGWKRIMAFELARAKAGDPTVTEEVDQPFRPTLRVKQGRGKGGRFRGNDASVGING